MSMFSSLPNTPYFRGLGASDVLDVSLTGEVLLLDDRVDFKKPSKLRKDRVKIQEAIFYVSLEEISKKYPPLVHVILKGIPPVFPDDFESLLRHICPSRNGLYPEPLSAENLLPLLRISHILSLEAIAQECRQFLYGFSVKQLSILQMIEIFNFLVEKDADNEVNSIGNVLHSGRSCLLKALLEHEDQNDLFCLMINGPGSPCISLLKRAMKHLHTLDHDTNFVNSSTPISCPCPKEEISGMRLFERRSRSTTPISLCGLVCSNCNTGFCSKCRKGLCPVKIKKLLLEHEEAEKRPVEEEEELDIPTAETLVNSSDVEESFDFPESSPESSQKSTPIPAHQSPIVFSPQILHPPPSQPIYTAPPPPPPGFSSYLPTAYQSYPFVPPPAPVLLPSTPCLYSQTTYQTVYQPVAQYQYSFSYM